MFPFGMYDEKLYDQVGDYPVQYGEGRAWQEHRGYRIYTQQWGNIYRFEYQSGDLCDINFYTFEWVVQWLDDYVIRGD